MDKRSFIQQMVIRHSNAGIQRVDGCITFAEECWAALTARGYGGAKKIGPRDSENNYAKLSPEQKEGFDKFWKAFNMKKGRSGAALSWLKIDPPTEEVEKIVNAARKEAQERPYSKITPKMAQGWLNERRWEDFEQEEEKKSNYNEERAGIISRINHANLMIQKGQNVEHWQGEVERLKQELIV